MPSLRVEDEVWNYAYLRPVPGMRGDDVDDFVMECIELYKEGKGSRMIKGESYEGRIKMGKHGVLVDIAGTSIEATLETDCGKFDATALIIQSIRPELN